ncbi:hypothetical protein POTOM_005255 [Populus tomentosa]|uniref:Uncharacterized protein n=1 Tax=Populus tomentosa TaxID=118781 RepID=A0A8X8AL62_POPTO|nr:hypothetical protein POTOM_005255 [Populus tomentosa]
MSSHLSSWSRLEDKQFEQALVLFPEETPRRWEKISSYVPGKSWREVRKHYEDLVHDVSEIDSGRVEVPFYDQDELWGDSTTSLGSPAAESRSGKEREHTERRKGTPWTEEEHRLFLIGLQKYGKGDWRSISRNAVVSRTPTQVASHAQKYFLRLNSVKKEKKRSSIHDITATNATHSMAQTNHDPIWNFELMDQSVDEPLSRPASFFHDQGNPPAYQGFGFPM